MKRRLLVLTMALLMLMSLVPMQAAADELLTEGSIALGGTTYSLCDGTLTISGEGEMSLGCGQYLDMSSVTDIVIEYGITEIPQYSFNGCTNINSVTLPESLTSIGSYAFCGCGIESIDLPESLTNIGNYAFSGCEDLENITMQRGYVLKSIGYEAFSDTAYFNNIDNWEDGVLYISSYLISAKPEISGACEVKDGTTYIATAAFYNCKSLESVTLSDLRYIGLGAFYGCTSLESVSFSSTVTNIDYYAFDGCTALADVYYKGTKAQWDAIEIHENNAPLFNATLHTENPVNDVSCTINGVTYKLENGIMNVTGNGVCTYAWRGQSIPIDGITELIINEGITKIEYELNKLALYGGTFEDCTAIESVTLPNSLTTIKEHAFRGCTALKDVYYNGTQAQWENISIRDGNEPLLNATIHFKETPFKDIENHWAYAQIAEAHEMGIVNGYPEDNTFRPDENITRAQFVTIIWNYCGNEKPEIELTFADADSIQEWYVDAVKWAVENGIIKGYEDNTFRPDAEITREEMAIIAYRLMALKGFEAGEDDAAAYDFTDADSIQSWAADAVNVMANNKLLTGYEAADGSFYFAPKGIATRAEATVVVLRIVNFLAAPES